jgi:hypothetical protein
MERTITQSYTREYIDAGMPAQRVGFERISDAIEYERSISKPVLSDQDDQKVLQAEC